MGTEPAFAGVEDTPMFRQRVNELEASFKRLKDRSDSFLTGARKYKDGVARMQDTELAFMASVRDFCGGGDEESLQLGIGELTPLVSTHHEITQNYDRLKRQFEAAVLAPLQHDVIDTAANAAREEHRKYDKKYADSEAARIKHLALKKVTKKDVLDKTKEEWRTAEKAAEEARYELATKLNEVESKKRYVCMELLYNSYLTQLRFYQDGLDAMMRLQPFMEATLQRVGVLKQEQEARSRCLADMIAQHRAQVEQRERLVEAHCGAVGAPGGPPFGSPASSMLGLPGVGPAGGGAWVDDGAVLGGMPAAPLGPVGSGVGSGLVQVSGNRVALQAEIERLIKATQASEGSGSERVTIIKQGYLCKKSQQSRSDWKRRFFVLDSKGMLYYYSHRDTLLAFKSEQKPKNTVALLTSTIKLDDEDSAMRFCFRVVSPEGTYTLQAENDLERTEWVEALQGVITVLLNDIHAAMPRKTRPVRATHSRHNSYGDLDGVLLGQAGSYSEGSQHSPYTQIAHANSGPMVFGFNALATIPSGADSGTDPRGSNGRLSELDRSNSLGALRRMIGHKWQGNVLTPLERLRRVAGNSMCCDCNAPEPDWASLNLGVLLCIECSGHHRQLGVEYSKVRSLTLDVKVWEQPVLQLFEAIGNEVSNKVWEANLSRRTKGESWVWCEDSDEDLGDQVLPDGGQLPQQQRSPLPAARDIEALKAQHRRSASTGALPANPRNKEVPDETLNPTLSKPAPTAPMAEKAKYVAEKYVARALAEKLPRPQAQSKLWDAVERGNIPEALAAMVGGADLNASYRTPSALKLVQDTQAKSQAGPGADDVPSACGNVTVLHAACAKDNPVMVEFLLQNGADYKFKDIYQRSALHYCVIHDQCDSAKTLLKRGADVNARDATSRTPMDLAISKGRLTDEDLLALLSKAS